SYYDENGWHYTYDTPIQTNTEILIGNLCEAKRLQTAYVNGDYDNVGFRVWFDTANSEPIPIPPPDPPPPPNNLGLFMAVGSGSTRIMTRKAPNCSVGAADRA